MRALKNLLVGLAACLLALAQPVWAAQPKAGLVLETGFSPSQDLTVWPLQIAHGYPLVRAQVGEVEEELAHWWETFQHASDEVRQDMVDARRLVNLPKAGGARRVKRGDSEHPATQAPAPEPRFRAADGEGDADADAGAGDQLPDAGFAEGNSADGTAPDKKRRRRRRKPSGGAGRGGGGGAGEGGSAPAGE